MRINIAEQAVLDKILERKKKEAYRPEDVDLKDMLREILTWANRFVPSESGSIHLSQKIYRKVSKDYFFLFFDIQKIEDYSACEALSK